LTFWVSLKRIVPNAMTSILSQLFSSQSAFTFTTLLTLVRVDDAETHLQHIYDWYFERSMTLMKTCFGAAGGSFATLLGAALDNNDGWPVWVLMAAGVVASALGVIQLRLLAHLPHEFASGLHALSRLRKSFP
jgi:hypothetical protein